MQKMERHFWLATALAGAAIVLTAAEPKQVWLEKPAPTFRLSTLDGKMVALADLRGKIVVLHFGAGW